MLADCTADSYFFVRDTVYWSCALYDLASRIQEPETVGQALTPAYNSGALICVLRPSAIARQRCRGTKAFGDRSLSELVMVDK